MAHDSQLSCDQARALEPIAPPNGQVEALANDVYSPIVEMKIELQIWVAREEVRNRFRQTRERHSHRRTDFQSARRNGPGRTQRVIGSGQHVEPARNVLQIDLSLLGQHHSSGRAIDQSNTEMSFQLANVLADRRRRKPELASCCLEAVRFGYAP